MTQINDTPRQAPKTDLGSEELSPIDKTKDETMPTFTKTVLASVAMAAMVAAPAVAKTIDASGTQTRGVAGRNAELKGASFTLPAGCTIASVSGDNAGFWLQGSRTIRFNDMASAQGASVPAGTYNAYPNLKQGARTASIKLRFNCPG